jgi:hypothetical protein
VSLDERQQRQQPAWAVRIVVVQDGSWAAFDLARSERPLRGVGVEAPLFFWCWAGATPVNDNDSPVAWG